MQGRVRGFNVAPLAKISLIFCKFSVFKRRHTTNTWALLLCTDKRRGVKLSQPKRKFFFFPMNCFKPPGWNPCSKVWMMYEMKSSCPASWERILTVLCHCFNALLFDEFSQVRTTKSSFFIDGEWAFLSIESVKANSVLQSMGAV